MRLAVLGTPIAHSLSPAIHTAALAAAGIPGRYEARDVDAAGFAAAVADIRSGELDGASVTMPHKTRALEASDRATAEARRAGAANTLVRVGALVSGHNTDIAGIRGAWTWNSLDPEGPVVVLGAGGAAAAALLALDGRQLCVAARRPEAASHLVESLDIEARVADLSETVIGATVVNATPIGMAGEALPGHLIEACVGYFEMAYASGSTPAEKAVAAAGRPTSSGVDLLVAQARIAFRLWTGRDVSIEVLREAVAPAF